MAKNQKINVVVDGDTTGLQKALNQAEGRVSRFGKKIGGDLGDSADKVASSIGRLSTGILGIAGVAAGAVAGISSLTLAANDLVRELNEISKASGLSVEEIQKWNKMFQSTGLATDKVMDLNQDTLDHLSDAYRNGTSLVQDFTSAGIDIKKLTPYLNQTDGGLKAIIDTFYQLKAAGADQGTQTWLLESISSDASRLIPILNQSTDAADAWNKISQQTATVTNETAEKFLVFDKNLSDLKTTGQGYFIDVLTPIVEKTNELVAILKTEPGDLKFWVSVIDKANEFQGILNKISLFPGMGLITKQIDNATKGYLGSQQNNLPMVNPLPATATAAAGVQPNASTGWVDKNKIAEQAAAAQKAREAAAAKAAHAAQQAAAKREQAERQLQTALSKVAENAGEERLKTFDHQQAVLIKTIQETGKIVGKSQKEIDAMVSDAQASGARQRNDLIDSMIGRTDPAADLKSKIDIVNSGISGDQKSFLANQQNKSINGNNPFAYNSTSQDLADNDAQMKAELELNEKLLGGTEDFEKRKAEIKAKYAAQAIEIENKNTQDQLTIMGNAAGSIADAVGAAFGQNTAAYQAAAAVQRGITMASIILNIQKALSEAIATPFPASLTAYAQVATLGAQILSTATGVKGQAHSGIDSVPGSLGKDSTWILQAGERVVSRGQNKQLQSFLDNNTGTNSNNSNAVGDIYAPLIVQGNIGDDDAKFQQMLKKHSQSVNQSVRDAQRRST
ncbi:hypothetical protein [Kluyvera georgiana]|uniref:hypothetical protein n=1 Tax=Kluyvera georgiana TaxID=73098 RepID=UPI003AF1D20B